MAEAISLIGATKMMPSLYDAAQQPLNTAHLRELARIAEQDLDWDTACFYYENAIARYPNKTGDLAKNDIQKLEHSAERCRHRAALADVGIPEYSLAVVCWSCGYAYSLHVATVCPECFAWPKAPGPLDPETKNQPKGFA